MLSAKLKKAGLIFLVPLLALPSGGCALTGTNGGGVNTEISAPLAGTLKDEKALYVAEAAFAGATFFIEAGAKSGLINGTNAALVNEYYGKAKVALDGARKAHLLGNVALRDLRASEVTDLVAQIVSLTKKR